LEKNVNKRFSSSDKEKSRTQSKHILRRPAEEKKRQLLDPTSKEKFTRGILGKQTNKHIMANKGHTQLNFVVREERNILGTYAKDIKLNENYI